MVIAGDIVEEVAGVAQGPVCHDYLNSLSKAQLPRFALAQGLWIGKIPYELRDLTLPEQMLVSLRFPCVFVFKLYPKDRRGNRAEHRGMCGNAVSFAWSTDKILDMLTGDVMPRPARLLASVIAVSFIETGKLPKKWLNATFRVRRRRVYEALCWLKANNPMYENFAISDAPLAELPEDGIPVEI
ncbi:hypothetical protein AURDEDRAFT_66791, partial [Auricularia subglabra TFB-10046 SS5]